MYLLGCLPTSHCLLFGQSATLPPQERSPGAGYTDDLSPYSLPHSCLDQAGQQTQGTPAELSAPGILLWVWKAIISSSVLGCGRTQGIWGAMCCRKYWPRERGMRGKEGLRCCFHVSCQSLGRPAALYFPGSWSHICTILLDTSMAYVSYQF